MKSKLNEKLQKIKLIAFDCDGVLTNGYITYIQSSNGMISEQKNFSARDGLGFKMMRLVGLIPAVITGRESAVLLKRCDDLKITHVYQYVKNKSKQMQELMAELGIDWENVAYMGDDWNDFPLLKRVGFSATPNNGEVGLREYVDYICTHDGGEGAAREIIDMIIKAQGKYETALDNFDL